MIPIGVAVVWLSYTTGIWSYCLVRGYNVKFTQLFKATWPKAKPTALQQSAAQMARLSQGVGEVTINALGPQVGQQQGRH